MVEQKQSIDQRSAGISEDPGKFASPKVACQPMKRNTGEQEQEDGRIHGVKLRRSSKRAPPNGHSALRIVRGTICLPRHDAGDEEEGRRGCEESEWAKSSVAESGEQVRGKVIDGHEKQTSTSRKVNRRVPRLAPAHATFPLRPCDPCSMISLQDTHSGRLRGAEIDGEGCRLGFTATSTLLAYQPDRKHWRTRR